MSREAAPDHRVRLISQGFNTWKVQVLFSQHQMTAAEISEQLSVVKFGLALQFGVPDSLLEYSGLLDKRATRNGLLVTMQIRKRSVPAGAPRFRGVNLSASDGTVFHDMILEADLFPYDEFDKPLTRTTIEAKLAAEHFDLSCVNWAAVDELLLKLQETGNPIQGVEIGRGRLPAVGRSSRITYGQPGNSDCQDRSLWIGAHPVREGEFLVEVSSAVSGLETGKNIYGRELSPRNGVETILEAGEGARLCMNGRVAKATRDGLVVFERVGRDRRDRDGSDLTPSRLRVRVLASLSFNEPQRFDLELYDAAVISADLLPGSRIVSQEAIFIEGQVAANCAIESADVIRIVGNIERSVVKSKKHLCVVGNVFNSDLEAGLSVCVAGRAIESCMRGIEVIAAETLGGMVDAIKRSDITHVLKSGSSETDIRVNLRRFLELQQSAGLEAAEDLRGSLGRIVQIFGPGVVAEVSDSSVQRTLLRWLRTQKERHGGNFTHQDVMEFRSVLEMIPIIRTQLTAIGIELKEVTSRLESDSEMPPSPESGSTP